MRRLLKIAIPILLTAVAAHVAIGASREAVIPDRRNNIKVEIAETPEKSGGIYYAYPVVSDSLPPVPEGFTPVYISHYGRHGSRWAINPKIYNESIEGMRKAEESGNLTETGKEVLAAIERCKANADGHLGELTLLGGKQHRGIAQRLYQRFPDVFKKGKIKARSSEVPRCVVSMANFTNSLISQDPSLDIDLYSGPVDMEILALTIPEKDKHKFNNKKEDVRRKIYKEKRDSLTRSIDAASNIFKNPEKVENLPALMRDIYDVAIAVQNVEGLNENLFTLFSDDELYNLWKSGNFGQYMDYGNTASSWGPGPDSALPLLRDIVARADSSLSGMGVPVDLRFGHDTVLMRLLALMRAKDCYADTDDLERAAEKWQNYKMSPMGANFQMIFYRNDEGKVIVTLRLNEQPLSLDGIPELYPGYYDYAVLNEILKSKLHPVSALVERVSPGRSHDFIFVEIPGDKDFFEIDSKDGKVMITGNNPVNIAAGLNWYLKYYAGVHLSWNNMCAELPATLPLPAQKEVRATDLSQRYYLNYCTHSYSMAFWDFDRWQKEIDWMAFHGINMPLAITGTDAVWRNTLLRLGYSEKEADEFVAGPAFQAWWLMNNLEGWGGPNSEKWYADRVRLQKDILAAMAEYGMTPVLPGYSGMIPHDAAERLGVEATGTGLWNGFIRPAFLKTTDPMFDKIADIYYEELAKVSGTSKYYSMDPFHEGDIAEEVDLVEAGNIILNAMKRVNPDAVWVIQGWNENPRTELLDGIKKGDIVVLDLASEIKPNWGDPESPSLTKRENGYGPHDWMYCMLLNFGGNVGLHGRMDNVLEGFYKARDSKYADTLTGLGLTPGGIENNPVIL